MAHGFECGNDFIFMFLYGALVPTAESLRGSEYREAMLLCMLLNDSGCWHGRVFFPAKIRAWWRRGGGKNRQRSAPDHPKTNGRGRPGEAVEIVAVALSK